MTLTARETEGCATRDDWARRFIQEHPSAYAFEVIGEYNQTELGEHLGYFSLDEILELQAERVHEELGALDDQLLIGEVMKRLWRRKESPRSSSSESDCDVIRHVWAVYFLDADVGIGGFEHYFANWSYDSIEDVMDGLVAMNAHEQLAIVGRATKLFLQGGDEPFEALDTAYSDSFSDAGIVSYLAPYIRAHLSAF